MTIFGWDASHYDYDRGMRANHLRAAYAEGIRFFTYKLTEGSKYYDENFGTVMRWAINAKIPFVGAYIVPRTPGNNGHLSTAAQVDYAFSKLDKYFPEWRTTPDFFFQVDTEHWSDQDGPYDLVSPNTGVEMIWRIREKISNPPIGVGRVVHYAPKWAYGNTVSGTDPLWASDYGGSGDPGPFKTQYNRAGGDNHRGWSAYSNRVPKILQFASDSVIGGQKTCDANAFRGTEADFRKMILGAPVSVPPPTNPPQPPKPVPVHIQRWNDVVVGPTGQKIVDVIERYYPAAGDLTITSAYRPFEEDGGTWSHHNGQIFNGSPTAAVDFAGHQAMQSVVMRDFAKWWYDNFRDLTVEMIHTTPFDTDNGYYVARGQVGNESTFGAATNAAHRNHVHLATSSSLLEKINARAKAKWPNRAP